MVQFLCYFQKFQLLVTKKIEMIFAALYFYLNELKRAQKLSKINMAKNERKISSFAGVGALQS